ncbi:MAG: glycosidase [Actinobacteria bacterium]|nr:glycosidase [Actinomycetota bacterium]
MALLTRTGHVLEPDGSRLVARPFLPDEANFGGGRERLQSIAGRVIDIPPQARPGLLQDARDRAEGSFLDIEARWREHYRIAAGQVSALGEIEDEEVRLLLGAFLTQGYAYEGLARTNPSMVPVEGGEPGSQRFVMSTRSVGEGFISSIGFMTGAVDADARVTFDEREPYSTNGARHEPRYDRSAFTRRLAELEVSAAVTERLSAELSPVFMMAELEAFLGRVIDSDAGTLTDARTVIHWLAASNYEVAFDAATPISGRVISPASPVESRGMEDARFVRFTGDDGETTYYATYTAYDGRRILPQMIRTADFERFRVSTMSGPMAQNKGIALFPRTMDGEFLALSRYDNQSIFVMRSDDIRHWTVAELVLRPELEWEAIQVGNCGSPLETERGWLVITHGVGPMRRYVLGAILLDPDEPAKVVGRLRTPLLEPTDAESRGNVPDVLYSCGGMIHGDLLVLPYGFADYGVGVAVGSVDEILNEMV